MELKNGAASQKFSRATGMVNQASQDKRMLANALVSAYSLFEINSLLVAIVY